MTMLFLFCYTWRGTITDFLSELLADLSLLADILDIYLSERLKHDFSVKIL
jgi:hypothetical protein